MAAAWTFEMLWSTGRVATGGLLPDLTVVLDMPAAAAAAQDRRPRDRMEQQGDEFHRRVREGFLAEAARQPEQITVVDASRLRRAGPGRHPRRRRQGDGAGRPQSRTGIPMSWHGIQGHNAVVELFRRALERQRLASSFLFAGPSGIGKRTFALKLAQAMLCTERPEAALDPCETCPSCTMALAGTHPDVDLVSKPADKAFLPLELLIGQREHRRQEGLCHNIGLKPFLGGRKIAVIDDADFLNAEGANCLLKTLEEPPPQSVLILVGTSPAKQLPPSAAAASWSASGRWRPRWWPSCCCRRASSRMRPRRSG